MQQKCNINRTFVLQRVLRGMNLGSESRMVHLFLKNGFVETAGTEPMLFPMPMILLIAIAQSVSTISEGKRMDHSSHAR